MRAVVAVQVLEKQRNRVRKQNILPFFVADNIISVQYVASINIPSIISSEEAGSSFLYGLGFFKCTDQN